MLRGLYSAASGMLANLTRMDVVSNNLANADSAGYKRQEVTQHAFNDLLLRRLSDSSDAANPGGPAPTLGTLGTGTYVDQIVTDYSAGSLKETGNPLDLSLRERPGEPLQFFAVDAAAGVRYVRTLGLQSLNGQLVTQDGNPVLGQNGPVACRGDQVAVTETGQVIVDGQPSDQLQVVTFPTVAGLRRIGQALYQATPQSGVAQATAQPQVLTGYQETSNVNPVLEMVRMMEVMRNYEAGQKAVQAQDGTLEKLLQIQA
ncbi:MAG: flagellar hook-basal body protein [Symbiobacteriia bacterium]